MKKDYTDITIVLDRSGSMSRLVDDVIGGVNTFIEEQSKVDGEATMTLVQFDNLYSVDYEAMPIADVKPLTREDYVPRGTTALLDAIGLTLVATGERLKALPEDERPDKVMLMIQTDGAENASKEYNQTVIKDMIGVQQDEFAWEIVFMGANIDAVATADNYGIKLGNALKFGANSVGVTGAFDALSKNMTSFRSGMKADMSYDDSDKLAQTQAGVSQS